MLGTILDIILWPVKFWYTTLLVILIADKIVAITPVPWDDLIVTAAKKITEKIMSFIDNTISSIIIKPVQLLFNNKDEEEKQVCSCSNDLCNCSNDGCNCK